MKLSAVFAAAKPAGVYRWSASAVPPAEIARAVAAGFTVGTVDLSGAQTKAEMFAVFQRDLAFPKWFGRNWDALVDSIGDWSSGSPKRLLVLNGVKDHDHGYNVELLLDVVRAAPGKTSFVILVSSSDSLDGVPTLI